MRVSRLAFSGQPEMRTLYRGKWTDLHRYVEMFHLGASSSSSPSCDAATNHCVVLCCRQNITHESLRDKEKAFRALETFLAQLQLQNELLESYLKKNAKVCLALSHCHLLRSSHTPRKSRSHPELDTYIITGCTAEAGASSCGRILQSKYEEVLREMEKSSKEPKKATLSSMVDIRRRANRINAGER